MSDLKTIIINIPKKQLTRNLIEEHKHNKEKKRVESEKWSFNEEEYQYENQIKIIKDILNKNYNYSDDVSKIMLQQINKKYMDINNRTQLKKDLMNQIS